MQIAQPGFSFSLSVSLSFFLSHTHTQSFSARAQPRFAISSIGEKKTKYRLRRTIHGEALGQCLRDCWRVQGQPRALIYFPTSPINSRPKYHLRQPPVRPPRYVRTRKTDRRRQTIFVMYSASNATRIFPVTLKRKV